jgi:hypothetical protein
MPFPLVPRGRRFASSLAVFTVAVLASVVFAQPPGFRRPVMPLPNPQMPKMPAINPPAPAPGIHLETVWKCKNCGIIVSHGDAPPIGTHCPGCGVLFVGADFSGAPIPPNGNGPAPGVTPPAGMPIQPPVTQPSANPIAPSRPSSASTLTSNGIWAIVVGVLILVVGLAVLGGAACLLIYSIAKKSPAPRRRRRRFEDDDDSPDDRPAFKRGSTGRSPVNGAAMTSQPGLPGFGL